MLKLWSLLGESLSSTGLPLQIFNELAARPFQSISHKVCLSPPNANYPKDFSSSVE